MSKHIEAMMPALFLTSLVMLGMAVAGQQWFNASLIALAAIGTFPTRHKAAWEPYICAAKR
jgi:hypothetical protein